MTVFDPLVNSASLFTNNASNPAPNLCSGIYSLMSQCNTNEVKVMAQYCTEYFRPYFINTKLIYLGAGLTAIILLIEAWHWRQVKKTKKENLLILEEIKKLSPELAKARTPQSWKQWLKDLNKPLENPPSSIEEKKE